MSSIDPSALKVVELRAELSKRDLSTKGKKDELIERLKEALDSENNSKDEEQSNQEIVEKQEEALEKQKEKLVEKQEEALEKQKEKLVEKQEEALKKQKEKLVESSKKNLAELPKDAPSVEQTTKTETTKPVEKVAEKTLEKVTEKALEKKVENKVSKNTDRSMKRRLSSESDRGEEKRSRVENKNTEKIDSSAIYVKGFVRPLIIKTVQELFGKYGQVKRFWMDSIKTHCYVVYETNQEAQSAYTDIHGIVFPKDTGKILNVGGLTPEQVEQLIDYEQSAAEKRLRVDWETTMEKVKSGTNLPSSSSSSSNMDNSRKSRSIGMGQIAKQLAQAAEPVPSASRQAQIEVAREPRERTLEDLFCKTKALPHLYYLPVSDEEAKIKLNKLQNVL